MTASEKFHRIMSIIKAMMAVETIGVIYILKSLFEYTADPSSVIGGMIKFSQLPSIYEHILMSVALTVGAALLFSILEKRGELA